MTFKHDRTVEARLRRINEEEAHDLLELDEALFSEAIENEVADFKTAIKLRYETLRKLAESRGEDGSV